MTNEEFYYIKSIIDKDIEKKDYTHLEQLKNYLLEFGTNEEVIFNNPELEAKKELLLMPVEELLKDTASIGINFEIGALNGTIDLLKEKDVSFDPRCFEVLGAHLIQLDEERVKNFRSVGTKRFNIVKEALEDKGLTFGNYLSKEENNRVLKAYSKVKTR